MINVLSVLDGFRILLGAYGLHFVAFLTLVFTVRIPTFEEDEERSVNAKILYWILAFYHFGLTVAMYGAMFLWKPVRS